jgi:hypothetical protein
VNVEEVTSQAATPQLSVEDMAANVAQGILEAEEGPQETPRDEKGKFTKAQPETEAQQEQPEAAQEEAVEEVVETPQEEVRRLKLKYKGEEKEFLEPEVIELAQKGYDYTQKSQALAKEREELSAKVKQEIETKHKQYEAQLEVYRQAVLKMADPEVISADLGKMAQEDPARAFQISLRRNELGQTLQAIATEQHRISIAREQEKTAKKQKEAREAVEILSNEIPGWSNEYYGKLMKTAVEGYGLDAEEVTAITNPRWIKVLHDAEQYRALKAKPVADKRTVPPAPKVAKPGAGEKPDAGSEQWMQTMAKLKKSGRTEDAVVLAEMMLAREAKQQK